MTDKRTYMAQRAAILAECGNSVCPQVAAALVAANYSEDRAEDTEPDFALVAAE